MRSLQATSLSDCEIKCFVELRRETPHIEILYGLLQGSFVYCIELKLILENSLKEIANIRNPLNFGVTCRRDQISKRDFAKLHQSREA